jgi:hypothetical protein
MVVKKGKRTHMAELSNAYKAIAGNKNADLGVDGKLMYTGANLIRREHTYWPVMFSIMIGQRQLQNVKYLGTMITNYARFRRDNEATYCTIKLTRTYKCYTHSTKPPTSLHYITLYFSSLPFLNISSPT